MVMNAERREPEVDVRIGAAVADYFRGQEEGRYPDPETWVSSQPTEILPALREFLDGLGLLGVPKAKRVVARELPDFGRYRDLRLVGSGGMGAVYRATDGVLKRLVAVKVMHTDLAADADKAERFLEEAQVVSQLQHPNIAPVYDYGPAGPGGRPFFTMRLIEGDIPGSRGRTFSEAVGEFHTRRDDAGRAALLRQFVGVCGAVGYAHASGVLHRDLKPGNVMVGEFGEVLVMDWGLSKVGSAASGSLVESVRNSGVGSESMTGDVRGTPAYMAPEQALGRDVGPAADVFALGGLLAFALSGTAVYTGPTAHAVWLAAKSCETEPCIQRVAASGAPPELVDIIRKCLADRPEHRPESAKALAGAVTGYQAAVDALLRAAESERAAAEARASEQKKKRRAQLALGGAMVLFLLCSTALAVFAAGQYRDKANVEAKALADLQAQSYATRIAVAERELTLNNDVGLAGELLKSCPEHLRGWEWHYLMRLRDGRREPISAHTAGLWSAVYSPDGRHVVTASIDGTAKVFNAADGSVVREYRGHELDPFITAALKFQNKDARVPVMCAAFSPDGLSVATGSLAPSVSDAQNPLKAKGAVHIWNVKTGKTSVVYTLQVGLVDTLSFSPDGKSIASSSISNDHSVAVWNPATGAPIGTLKGHTSHVHRVRFSPDGALLATGCTDGTLKLWDMNTLTEARSIAAHDAPIYDIAFTADSSRVATASVDGTIRVFTSATGEKALEPLRGHAGAAMGVVFSPDSRRIATAGYDKTVRIWDAATGIEQLTLRGHDDIVTCVSFRADGLQLVSSSFDSTVRIWDATPREDTSSPGIFTLDERAGSERDSRVNSVAFSGDGRRLVSGGWDKTVRILDANTGETIRILEGHAGAIWGVAITADGSRVVSASWDRTAKVWDAETGRALVTFEGHATPLQGLALSSDGKTAATCSYDGIIKIWDANSGYETAQCAGHLFPCTALAFSRDGRWLASGSGDRKVKVWNAKTGKEWLTLEGHQGMVNSVSFSEDGRRLASASWDHTGRIWDITEKKELAKKLDRRRVEQLEKKLGKPLDLRSDRLVDVLVGHEDRVQGIAFSPDGNRIVTGGEDKRIRFWDAAKGEEIIALTDLRHRGIIWGVAYSPDGTRVASGCWSKDGWLKTWKAP